MLVRLTIAIAILSLLGFADATYLTILHYQNAIPPCTIAHGCETVLTSNYATIVLGIPTAVLGVLYYIAVFIITLLFAQTKKTLWVAINGILTSFGFIIALLLTGIQAFILHAFCQYCLASEFVDLLLVICALFLVKVTRKKTEPAKN